MGTYADQGGQLFIKEDTHDFYLYFHSGKGQWIVGSDPNSGEGWVYAASAAEAPHQVHTEWSFWDAPSGSWMRGGQFRVEQIGRSTSPVPLLAAAAESAPPAAKTDGQDPFETFMASIETAVTEQKARATAGNAGATASEKVEKIDRFDEQEKQAAEEAEAVRRAAKAFRKTKDQLDAEDAESKRGGPRSFAQLEPVDHASRSYRPLQKDLWSTRSAVSYADARQIETFRREHAVVVSGEEPPPACLSFSDLPMPVRVRANVQRQGFTTPTPIQAFAIPAALRGRDVLAIAKTGSGKTHAFLIPLVAHALAQPRAGAGQGPVALIIGPTRELCLQTYDAIVKLTRGTGLKTVLAMGGMNRHEQVLALKRGVDIAIGTPGRLIDLVGAGAATLARVSVLVVDEADRMLSLGFEPQLRCIASRIRPDRQTLLYSATFPRRAKDLARDMLTRAVRVAVGPVGAANVSIRQIVDVVAEADKLKWMAEKIDEFVRLGRVLVFAGTQARVELLARQLARQLLGAARPRQHKKSAAVGFVHGGKTQYERLEAVRRFKKQNHGVLVATDVASRGLDIRGLNTVVNYDVAKNAQTHVHRIGRTGRAGESGTAYTLFCPKTDMRMARPLVQSLQRSGQPVPAALRSIAMATPQGSTGRRRGQKISQSSGLGSAGAGYSRAPLTAAQAAARSRRPNPFLREARTDDKKKKLFGSLLGAAPASALGSRAKRRPPVGASSVAYAEKAHGLAQESGGSFRTRAVRQQFASAFCEAQVNDLADQFAPSQGSIIIPGRPKKKAASSGLGGPRKRRRRSRWDEPPSSGVLPVAGNVPRPQTHALSSSPVASQAAPASSGMHPERARMLGLS